MSYHGNRYSGGTVAVSFSKGPMAPLSPTISRRFPNGTSSSSSGSSTLGKYRTLSDTYNDRANNYLHNHTRVTADYNRFYNPSRSVAPSAYSESGSPSSSTRISTLARGPTITDDIIAKYSPKSYVPVIHKAKSSPGPGETSSSGAEETTASATWSPTKRRSPSSVLYNAGAEVNASNNNNEDEDETRCCDNDFSHSFPTNTDNTQLLANNNARFRQSALLIKVPGEFLFDGDEGQQQQRGPQVGDAVPYTSHADDLPSSQGERRGGDRGTDSDTDNGPEAGAVSAGAVSRAQGGYRPGELIEGSPTSRASCGRLQAHRDERCGLNGLRNIGNTCFMNSVIQCLSNTRPLLEYLLNEQYLADINTTTSGMKGALIKAFSQVIHELWEVGGDHVVNTTALKSQIQRFAPRFIGYSQQDAQEFLRYLLEGLHEDVNRVTVKPQPIHTDIPDHYTDSQKATESWKRYLRSEDSQIVDIFVGQLRSSLRCTACDHVSVTLDPFWDLSLPIPTRSGTVKLSQCLEHFTKEEVLDGDEKPTCSKCQMRRKCTKSFSIQKFPKILVIHLKRFSPMERFRGKLNVLVDFPLTGLDLSAFAAPRVQGCTYSLYGIANHSGTTYSGHYTAYCKHPYSGDWHEYNDSRVSQVPSRSVVTSEGYVLFYEQQPHSSHL